MAVTRDGLPIRCWTFPANEADTAITRRVEDDLAGWDLPPAAKTASAATSNSALSPSCAHHLRDSGLRQISIVGVTRIRNGDRFELRMSPARKIMDGAGRSLALLPVRVS